MQIYFILIYSICLLSVVSPEVVINGYTHNKILSSGDSVSLGIQLILVCQVVGLPFGVAISYTWICPQRNTAAGWYGQKIYNEYTFAINIISTHDGGTCICQVTTLYSARQEVNGSFLIHVSGMCKCIMLSCS